MVPGADRGPGRLTLRGFHYPAGFPGRRQRSAGQAAGRTIQAGRAPSQARSGRGPRPAAIAIVALSCLRHRREPRSPQGTDHDQRDAAAIEKIGNPRRGPTEGLPTRPPIRPPGPARATGRRTAPPPQPSAAAAARQHRPRGEPREAERHRQGRPPAPGRAARQAPSAAATAPPRQHEPGPGRPASHTPPASSASAAAARRSAQASSAPPASADSASRAGCHAPQIGLGQRRPGQPPAGPEHPSAAAPIPASRAVPPLRQHQPGQHPGQASAGRRSGNCRGEPVGKPSVSTQPSARPARRPAPPVPAPGQPEQQGPAQRHHEAGRGRARRRPKIMPAILPQRRGASSPGCIRSRVGRAQAAATPVGRRVSGQHDQVGFAFLQPHRHTAAHCQAIVVTVMAPLVLCMASPGR